MMLPRTLCLLGTWGFYALSTRSARFEGGLESSGDGYNHNSFRSATLIFALLATAVYIAQVAAGAHPPSCRRQSSSQRIGSMMQWRRATALQALLLRDVPFMVLIYFYLLTVNDTGFDEVSVFALASTFVCLEFDIVMAARPYLFASTPSTPATAWTVGTALEVSYFTAPDTYADTDIAASSPPAATGSLSHTLELSLSRDHSSQSWGLHVEKNDRQLYPLVIGVEDGSPADTAGVHVGDKIQGWKRSGADLYTSFQSGGSARSRYMYGQFTGDATGESTVLKLKLSRSTNAAAKSRDASTYVFSPALPPKLPSQPQSSSAKTGDVIYDHFDNFRETGLLAPVEDGAPGVQYAEVVKARPLAAAPSSTLMRSEVRIGWQPGMIANAPHLIAAVNEHLSRVEPKLVLMIGAPWDRLANIPNHLCPDANPGDAANEARLIPDGFVFARPTELSEFGRGFPATMRQVLPDTRTRVAALNRINAVGRPQVMSWMHGVARDSPNPDNMKVGNLGPHTLTVYNSATATLVYEVGVSKYNHSDTVTKLTKVRAEFPNLKLFATGWADNELKPLLRSVPNLVSLTVPEAVELMAKGAVASARDIFADLELGDRVTVIHGTTVSTAVVSFVL